MFKNLIPLICVFGLTNQQNYEPKTKSKLKSKSYVKKLIGRHYLSSINSSVISSIDDHVIFEKNNIKNTIPKNDDVENHIQFMIKNADQKGVWNNVNINEEFIRKQKDSITSTSWIHLMKRG